MFHFDAYTGFLCLLGWIAHWLFGWGVEWRKAKKGLFDYLDDDPPAFYFSLVITLAVYLIGPSIIPALGITLPIGFEDPAVKGTLALIVGYAADSFFSKGLRLFVPQKEGG